MTSGELCVMMVGTVLMPVWSASSWVMQPQEVSVCTSFKPNIPFFITCRFGMKKELYCKHEVFCMLYCHYYTSPE